MLYLACTTIFSVDLAQYGVSLAKDWVSVECGTNEHNSTKKNVSAVMFLVLCILSGDALYLY